jgi:hypothetical protein
MRKVLVFCSIVLMSLLAMPGTAFGEQQGSDTPKQSEKELRDRLRLGKSSSFLALALRYASLCAAVRRSLSARARLTKYRPTVLSSR